MIAVCAGFGVLQLAAQSADEESARVFNLDPFVVEGGTSGYLSASSMLGGRMNTELKDTAVAVSVLTPELLEDIGALSVAEAVAWAPNSVPQAEISGQSIFNDYGVSFRGLGTSFQARNFFIWYVNSDYFNTSRIDISRGPNSLVFGDAGIAGVSNVSTQRAVFANTAEVYTHVTGEGGWRSHPKANVKITDNFALMGAAVYDDNQLWQDRAYAKREGYYLTLGYKPFKATRIDIEYEDGTIDRVVPDFLFDVHTTWNGTPVTEPFPANANPPPEQGISVYRTNYVFNPAMPGLGYVNWSGWGRSAGSQNQILDRPVPGTPDDAFRMPYLGFHNGPGNKIAANPFKTWSLFINHNFRERFYIEAAYNFQQQERILDFTFWNQLNIDVNQFLPDLTPNPGFGRYFADANPSKAYQRNRVGEYRLATALLFDIGSIGSGRLLTSGGFRSDKFELSNRRLVRTNNPANLNTTSTENYIQIRRYLDERDLPVSYPGAIGDIQTGWAQYSARTEEKRITYGQMAFSGAFIDNSFNLLAGVRHDKFERFGNKGVQTVDPVTKEILGLGPNVIEQADNITTTSVGPVFHLTPWMSLAINYAESFFPIGSRTDINGDAIAAYDNDGYDAGLRFAFLDGRVNASVNYYSNEQRNVSTNGAGSSINGLWSILEKYKLVEPGLQVDPNYSDFYSYSGKGFEVEVVANVTESWKVFFNVSFPETAQIDGLADTRNYYNENIGTWRALRGQITNKLDTAVFDQRLKNLENFLVSFQEGRPIPNTFDYTLNVFTDYAFQEGRLDGFSVGLGARMRGQRLVTYGSGLPLYADAYKTLTAKVGYDFTWRGVEFGIQLNVENLLDETVLTVTEFDQIDGEWLPTFFFPQDPRTFRLSLTAKF